MGHRLSGRFWRKHKSLAPARIRSPDRSVRSYLLYLLRYFHCTDRSVRSYSLYRLRYFHCTDRSVRSYSLYRLRYFHCDVPPFMEPRSSYTIVKSSLKLAALKETERCAVSTCKTRITNVTGERTSLHCHTTAFGVTVVCRVVCCCTCTCGTEVTSYFDG